MPEYQYLDASAIVKLVIHEHESAALRRFLRTRQDRASSKISWTEVPRAVRRAQPTAILRARQALTGVVAIGISERILDSAATLGPVELRTLDAIHLATAASLGPDLGAVVTYDQRMASAAAAIGISVVSPQ